MDQTRDVHWCKHRDSKRRHIVRGAVGTSSPLTPIMMCQSDHPPAHRGLAHAKTLVGPLRKQVPTGSLASEGPQAPIENHPLNRSQGPFVLSVIRAIRIISIQRFPCHHRTNSTKGILDALTGAHRAIGLPLTERHVFSTVSLLWAKEYMAPQRKHLELLECRSGETGRRTGLKIQRAYAHVGSTPTSGTRDG